LINAVLTLLILTAAPPSQTVSPTAAVLEGVVARFHIPSEPGQRVRGEWVATVHPRGSVELPLSVFLPGDLRFEALATRWSRPGDTPESIRAHREPANELLLSATSIHGDLEQWRITLPTEASELGALKLTLDFEIGSCEASGSNCRLPVPVLEIPPLQPDSNQLFAAEITIPPGLSFVEGFPTGFRRLAGNRDHGPAIYKLSDYPVVPRFLSVYVAAGPAPLLTTARLADAATVVILLTALGAAWRRFRSLAE